MTPQGREAIFKTPLGVSPNLDGAFWNYVLSVNTRRRFHIIKDILLSKIWQYAERVNDLIEKDYENRLLWKLRQRVLNACEALA